MATQTETLDASRTGVSQLQRREPGLVLVWTPDGPMCQPYPTTTPVTIGRQGFGADIELADRQISRKHCKVGFVVQEHWHITDLGSRNGTFVDRGSVTGEHWTQGSPVIRVGRCLFLTAPDCLSYQSGVRVEQGRVNGPVLRTAWDMIAATTQFSDTLLVTGESGAGKEMAARRYHDRGPRPKGPYIAVNCATIPEGVAERLLFGSRKGAFSGAENSVGYLQAADGGTLFLDEVGELDLAIQGKLLRVLETRQVLPLGASKPRNIDIRIVLATHRDLRKAVEAKTFREDLYFRVARPEVHLPPLRERREEIPVLVNLALQQLNELNVTCTAHPSLIETCLLRPWPGNVRELLTEIRTAAQRAVLDGRESVEASDLDRPAGMGFAQRLEQPMRTPAPIPTQERSGDIDRTGPQPIPQTSGRGHAQARRQEIVDALTRERGNVTRSARTLGVHRTQLRRWINALGLDPQTFK